MGAATYKNEKMARCPWSEANCARLVVPEPNPALLEMVPFCFVLLNQIEETTLYERKGSEKAESPERGQISPWLHLIPVRTRTSKLFYKGSAGYLTGHF